MIHVSAEWADANDPPGDDDMATATLPKAFNVLCPLCNEGEGVGLNLNDLGQCYCEACSESFTVAKAIAVATERLAAWQKVARFVEMGRALAAE